MPQPVLLDTTVLLHWVRDSPQAETIDGQFQLFTSAFRPLVCVVSLGEMRTFARTRGWTEKKLQRLGEIQRLFSVIDISDERVLDAFAELSTLAKRSGWSLFTGKNDLWIGAAARVADAHLITMDVDFLPLRGRSGWTVTVLDPKSALPLP